MEGVFLFQTNSVKRICLLIFLILGQLVWAQGQPFKGKVVGIKDGDTFKVLHNRKEYTIRLAHIDAPEKKQPFGNKSKQYASTLCFGKEVLVRPTQRNDRYGRIIAEIIIGNRVVNKELVKQGLAWHFTKYSKSQEYVRLEREARQKRIGIWSEKSPIAPWDWRKGKR